MVAGRVYVSAPSHSGHVQSGSWQCSKRFLAIAPVQGEDYPGISGAKLRRRIRESMQLAFGYDSTNLANRVDIRGGVGAMQNLPGIDDVRVT